MSASANRTVPFMDVTDFLEWDGDRTGQNHELIEGEVRAMAPAGARHGTIQNTLGYLLTRHLDGIGSPCRVVVNPGVIPRVRANLNFRIPDLGVTCIADEAGQASLPEPILLLEILSPGNAADTRANVWTYTSIPSVQEILIVHIARVKVELLRRREDGSWPEQADEIGPGGSVVLDSIGLAIPIAQIYARTRLAEGTTV